MAKWNNSDKSGNVTKSFEGGAVYSQEVETRWMNMLFTSLMSDRFYESEDDQVKRFIEDTRDMVDKYGAKLVANCAVYARREVGVRSISTLLASVLNSYQFEGKRDFYFNFFNRADDVAELFACVDSIGGKRSHGLVNGTRDYVETCVTEYNIGKYTLNGKKYNWFDIVNITHANSPVIDKLKRNGKVDVPDTWETRISACKSDKEKNDVWFDLVTGGKLGYMALIRNLRNILSCDFCDNEFIKEHLVPYIANKKRIIGSRIFPYQIANAAFALAVVEKPLFGDTYDLGVVNPYVLGALSDAFVVSVENMPSFEGENIAIVIDVSGSMNEKISRKSVMTMKVASAAYAAAFALANPNVEIYKFADRVSLYKFAKSNNIFSTMLSMASDKGFGYGTQMRNVVEKIKMDDKHYDRMFVFSDCQVYTTYAHALYTIRKSDIANCADKSYCFDLAGYGKSVLNDLDSNVLTVNSLSDSVFSLIPKIDGGYKSLMAYFKELDLF